MADQKISQLTDGTPAQTGDEIPVARSGANVRITAGDIATLANTTPLTVPGTSSSTGEVRLAEDTDNGTNYVGLKAPAAITSNVSWTLPAADGTANQVLSTNGSATLSWATVTASAAGSDTQVQFNDGGTAFGGDAGLTYNKTTNALSVSGPLTVTPDSDAAAATLRRNSSGQTNPILQVQTEANAVLATFDKTGALNLGVAGATKGVMTLSGNTSGTVTIQPAAAAGTYTLTLPTNDGDASQVLTTDGSGVLSWTTVSGGSITTPLTVPGTSSATGAIRLAEDTDNGTNYVAFAAPATIASDVTWTLPAADGTSGQVLSTDGSGTLSWATASATPAGSDTEIQFNDGGSSFGGDAGLTYNKTTNVLTNTNGQVVLTGGTVTASTPLISATQTWNASGTTFNGVLLNVTNTASAAASLLMNLQVGGTSRFTVDTNGGLTITGPASSGATLAKFAPSTGTAFVQVNNNGQLIVNSDGNSPTRQFSVRYNGVEVVYVDFQGNVVGNGQGAFGSINIDASSVILDSEGGHVLAQRNGANAQTFRLYGTSTSATSFERLALTHASSECVIATQKGSTGGTARSLIFQTDSTTALTLTTAQKAEFVSTVKTGAPAGGTAAEWKLGTVATVSPTSPNRTIEVEIGGTTYYLHAKTTND